MRPWHDEQHIEIGAPAEAIYRYLADFGSQLDWSSGVTSVDLPPGGHFVVGAEFQVNNAHVQHGCSVKITALQAPMRVAWDTTTPRAFQQREFLIIPSAGPTTLVHKLALQPRSALRWRLRDRWRRSRISSAHRAELAQIKAIVEALQHGQS
jgi:hypothetical protein